MPPVPAAVGAVTPEERSERARKAARARWALGNTGKRRTRAEFYARRIVRAIESGDPDWLNEEQRRRVGVPLTGDLGGGCFLRVIYREPEQAPAFFPDQEPGNCDDPWPGDSAFRDSLASGKHPRASAKHRITARIADRILLR